MSRSAIEDVARKELRHSRLKSVTEQLGKAFGMLQRKHVICVLNHERSPQITASPPDVDLLSCSSKPRSRYHEHPALSTEV